MRCGTAGSTKPQCGLQAIIQFREHFRLKVADLFLEPVLGHQGQQRAANQTVPIQARCFALGRGGFDKQVGRIVFLVQVGCYLSHDRVTQALIVIVGLYHHDGAFFAAAAGSMGETGFQNIAAPEVHESSGSSKPSPASRSAVSAASQSISSSVQGLIIHLFAALVDILTKHNALRAADGHCDHLTVLNGPFLFSS